MTAFKLNKIIARGILCLICCWLFLLISSHLFSAYRQSNRPNIRETINMNVLVKECGANYNGRQKDNYIFLNPLDFYFNLNYWLADYRIASSNFTKDCQGFIENSNLRKKGVKISIVDEYTNEVILVVGSKI